MIEKMYMYMNFKLILWRLINKYVNVRWHDVNKVITKFYVFFTEIYVSCKITLDRGNTQTINELEEKLSGKNALMNVNVSDTAVSSMSKRGWFQLQDRAVYHRLGEQRGHGSRDEHVLACPIPE